MRGQPSQYRTLRAAFLRRFTEHELLSSSGDTRELLSNVMAALAALGVCVTALMLRQAIFGLPKLPPELRDGIVCSNYEFLMSMTIAVAGVFVIVCWDAFFPDREDCMVLAAQPVRMRSVLAAKLAAVGAVFGLLVGGANAIPLLLAPPLMAGTLGGAGIHTFFLAQFTATAAAALFVFAAAAAVQGVLINVLPYRLFRRASAWVQLAAVFALLAAFLAAPGGAATPEGLANPANRWAITLIPSFWFFGLAMAVLGTTIPAALWLAKIAVTTLAVAVAVAVLSYTLGYARYVRRAVEDSGLAPEARGGSGIVTRIADRWLLAGLPERAVFHFVLRTMTRSRTHRLILAGYMSVALAYLAVGNGGLLEGRGLEKLFRPDAMTGGVPLVLAFLALAGMRALFSVPVDLQANWLFRFTESAPPAAVRAAARKLMLLTAILPAAALSLLAFSILWGPAMGARFTVIVLLILLISLERLMRDFRKLPFTCAYLPGKSNMKLMFAVYATAFSLGATLATWIAVAASGNTRVFAVVALMCAAWLAWTRWRRRRAPGWERLVYEDRPDWQPLSLELT